MMQRSEAMGVEEFKRLWSGAVVTLRRDVRPFRMSGMRAAVVEVVRAGTRVEVLRPHDNRGLRASEKERKILHKYLGPNWMTCGRVDGSSGEWDLTLKPEDVVAGSATCDRPRPVVEPGVINGVRKLRVEG